MCLTDSMPFRRFALEYVMGATVRAHRFACSGDIQEDSRMQVPSGIADWRTLQGKIVGRNLDRRLERDCHDRLRSGDENGQARREAAPRPSVFGDGFRQSVEADDAGLAL